MLDIADSPAPITPAAGLTEPTEPPKPLLRGAIHAVCLPLVIAAGTVIIVQASGAAATAANAIFIASAIMLFGCSAAYHRGHWGPRGAAVLRRLDHSNIAIIIAGTYTPLALLLPPATTRVLLWVIWGGALAVIAVRVFWLGAPRWSYVPLYIALGWVAVWFLPQFWRDSGPGIVWLVLAGGIAYTAGAIIYGLKRPNPWPRWFGFHEIFHTLTVVGFGCHFVAVAIITARG